MLRVTVLKAKGGGVDALLAYHGGLAQDQQSRDGAGRGPVDYYLDSDEPPGRWWGDGRGSLGLDGEVTPEQLSALLTARRVDQVDTQGLTVALFRQHTSRPADPQLHTHAVIAAKVADPTGRWLSLDARFLLKQQRSIGWVYDAALRAELAPRLGVVWDPVPEGLGQSDIAGVPEELRALFSQRSVHVEEKLAELLARWVDEHDGAEPDRYTIGSLTRTAVLTSRPPKGEGTAADALRSEWVERALEAGFDPAALPIARGRPDPVAWDVEAVIAEAVERVGVEASKWLRPDLAREIATLVPPGAVGDGEALNALLDELAEQAAARCVELHRPPLPGVAKRGDGRPVRAESF